MPRDARDTKTRILEAAYELFYRDGFGGVGVDAIAAAAGVTKRTLYYHFGSKDDLIAETLDHQHDLAWARVDRWLGRAEGSAAGAIEAIFAGLGEWMASPGWRGSGFSRAAIELAGLSGHPARMAASRHKKAVESAIAGIIGADDARTVVVLIEGALTLALIHRDPSYLDAAASAARDILSARP